MNFDKEKYTVEELELENEKIRFRAFRNLVYVENPVNPDYQQMNLYVPEDYYEGGNINGYTLNTAPIFMPNPVGGYMPGLQEEPGYSMFDKKRLNSVFRAIQHGYVVASPAIRGRVQQDEDGTYTGKAPACVVDHKAAVRYLRYFKNDIPGDAEKIITNGTSAGGALSSLMGATGNHPDYEPYLEKLGAAEAKDHVFASSCYCPITNLDHADSAYEWEFFGENEFHMKKFVKNDKGEDSFEEVTGFMDEIQRRGSKELKKQFPGYVNSLYLEDEDGSPLALDENGEGTFKEYVKKVVLDSASRAMERGADLSGKTWLSLENGKVEDMDFTGYVKDITRMKPAPAFDGFSNDTPENSLFGDEKTDKKHFTLYSADNSLTGGSLAEKEIIKMLNPMYYIGDENADTVKYWRIRHGECDRDTSLAISAMLTAKLRNNGCQVDYHSPWGVPHSGDYDLDEPFAWIDGICKDK